LAARFLPGVGFLPLGAARFHFSTKRRGFFALVSGSEPGFHEKLRQEGAAFPPVAG
jgi:hypothetical protein